MVSVYGNSVSPQSLRTRIILLIFISFAVLAILGISSGPSSATTFQLKPKTPIQLKKPALKTESQSSPPTMMGPMHQELPDLTIRTIRLDKQNPFIGTRVSIKATIYNLGSTAASNITVQFTYKGRHQTKTIRQLKSRKSGVVSTDIIIQEPAGAQIVEVRINPGKRIKETNYDNNRQQKNLRARAPLTITPNEKPTLTINKRPDITTVIPGSLKQGSQTGVRLRGKNIDRFMRFDFGSCISPVGTPLFNDEIRITLKVSDGCSPGRHPIKIKSRNKEYTASAAITVSSSPRKQTTPDLRPKPTATAITPPGSPEISIIPKPEKFTPGNNVDAENQTETIASELSIVAMTPNRWQQGNRYTVILRGSHLDSVFRIDFGPKITVENFKKISASQIETIIKVAADASAGHRTVNVLSQSSGQVGSGIGLATQYDSWVTLTVKKEIPEINHDYTLPDDFLPRGIELLEPNPNVYGKAPISLTEKTHFIWREKKRPIAETFEFRVLAADGTLLHHSQQEHTLQHPSQFFYSNIDLLIELHDALEDHLQSSTGIAAGESPISPNDARQEADLYWEVYGYLDNKAIESSDRWPLKIGGKGPTGMLCDTTNTQLVPLPAERNELQPGASDPATASTDQAYYPGEFVRIYGEFTLANSPWSISATPSSITNKTDVKVELGSGNVLYNTETKTNGYRFDNVFIDWGDGSSEPVTASLKNSKTTTNFTQALYDFSDPMIIEMGHSYNQPGTYPVRIYVVPIDDMGATQAIARLNNTTTAQYKGTSPPPATEHILLAASESIISDAPVNYGVGSSQQALKRVGEEERNRVYQVYCNPMNIYIVQDPEATGPLKLQSIQILEFSSQSSQAAPDGRRRNHSAPQTDMAGQGLSQTSTGAASLSTASSLADQVSIAADGSAFSCDAGLWTEAALLYIGQGYIQLDWLLDGIVLKSEQLKVGPSTPRNDLGPNRTKWPPSEPSTTFFQSPRLPVQNPMLHKLTVIARVIVDPTLSTINSTALQDTLNRYNEGDSSATLPPVDKNTIDISFLSRNKTPSSQIKPSSPASGLQTSWGTSSSNNLIMAPPYRVVSEPKSYLVTENDTDTPCQFQFPVENGFFTIANLRNLQASNNSGTYSGEGSLIFNLPDGPYSVKEHFLPISFTNWDVPDATTVTAGEIDIASTKQLDNLPGVRASLKQLTGQAGASLDATMNVEISDPTLYSATSASGAVQKWTDVTAPLTPAGDWYSPPLALPLTRIGWSLVQIEAPDSVRIDLSHSEGLGGCTGTIAHINSQQDASGQNWVGLHLGSNALLHPYTFHLADQTIPAPGWGVNGGGICGTARSNEGFTWNFGDAGGKIGWTDIEISAGNGTLSSNYDGFYVEMTWPKVKLAGEQVSFQYHGETVEPQMDLGTVDVPGGVISEEYGDVDMAVEVKTFESRDKLWGINTNTTFKFHEKNNSFEVFVPDLFFTLNNDAEFNGKTRTTTIPTNIESTLGGAGLTLDTVDINTGKRSVGFVHHATLKLGAELNDAKTTVMYNILGSYSPGDAGPSLSSDGPTMGPLEEEISITFKGGGVEELNKSTLSNVTYLKSDGSEVAGCMKENTMFAYNTHAGSFSDAWPDFSSHPLLASNGPGTGIGVCANDTFSASVDTSLFSTTYSIEFLFRYGEMDNDNSYWLMSADKQDLNLTIYPNVILSSFTGGIGYNFSAETIRSMGCAGPQPNGALILSAEVGISAVNPNVLKGIGVLTLDLGQMQAEIGLEDITLIEIDSGFSGAFTLSSGGFQGSIQGDKRFLDGNIMLEGDAEIYLGPNDWYLNIGTISEPLNGRVFSLLRGSTYLTLDKSGFASGFQAGYDLDSGEILGCSIRTYLDLGANCGFKTSPFSFSGTAYTKSGITLVNPVKDLDIGTGLDFTVGCCSPKELITSWSGGFCPGVKAGFTLGILPDKFFKPYFKGCIKD